mmetsp:Transcript_3899/g.16719  ORF Transcript_3899/g.16719 Transcript_3899/m.16719 type:complete len:145 (+) Transcript_3899:1437-1871(+)
MFENLCVWVCAVCNRFFSADRLQVLAHCKKIARLLNHVGRNGKKGVHPRATRIFYYESKVGQLLHVLVLCKKIWPMGSLTSTLKETERNECTRSNLDLYFRPTPSSLLVFFWEGGGIACTRVFGRREGDQNQARSRTATKKPPT